MNQEIERFGLQTAIVCKNPPVLLIGMDIGSTGFREFSDGSTSIDHLAQIVGENGHLVVNPWWYVVGNPIWDARLAKIAEICVGKRAAHGHFFCNCPTEVEYVRSKFGLDAHLINHNIFAQVDTFDVRPEPKVYRAVYNAKLTWFKRHWLAQKVQDLALIYSPFGAEAVHVAEIRRKLPQAAFLNGDPLSADYVKLTSEGVCQVLNSARVGLCLSELEGAMYGSIEYLLCGLGVVSTRNHGGRDQFFDDRYCRTVDPNPDAVAAAVDELIARIFRPIHLGGNLEENPGGPRPVRRLSTSCRPASARRPRAATNCRVCCLVPGRAGPSG